MQVKRLENVFKRAWDTLLYVCSDTSSQLSHMILGRVKVLSVPLSHWRG